MDVLVNGCVDGVQNPNLSSDLFHFEKDFGSRGIIKGRDCELLNYLISISYSVLSFYQAFCCANENSGQFRRIRCFKDQKVLRGSRKPTKKLNALNNFLDERALSNILWWKEVCYIATSYFIK